MPARRPSSLVRASLVALAVALGFGVLLARQAQTPQTTQTPVFRGTTSVVPIDVRVLNKNGQPVTDLKAADFTVFENGIRQNIDYFSPQALAPEPPEPEDIVRTPIGAAPVALVPATRRLFLIFLGRGRLQEPSKGVDATLRFVKERLMPQDQVAIMAWNRATDFSSDKTRALAVLQRFKTKHEEIEHAISLYFEGLSRIFGVYGGNSIPPHVQTMINDVFDPAFGADTRLVLPSTTLQAAANRDIQRVTDFRMDRAVETFRLFSGTDVQMPNGVADGRLGVAFDDFVAGNRQTMQDVGNIYAGIDYLRFIDGEKHLIYVTEQGFSMPRADYEREMAQLASDARVALDTIQTGGVSAGFGEGGYMSVSNGFALRALREVSDISGGQSSTSKYAEAAFDRIVSSTEFSYLLGYSPANGKADGKARNLRVEVNRKDVSVSYRHGYVARPESAKYDPRESLAFTRLIEAVGYEPDIPDLSLKAKLLDLKEAGQAFVNVEVAINASRLRFVPAPGDRYVAAMNFAVVCGDSYQKDVGQLWESKDIFVPASRYDEIKRTGVTVTLKVAVKQPPRFVKIVAYDYGSDLMGSILKVMK